MDSQEWVWVQDRNRSMFICVTTPQHLVCYKHVTTKEEHDAALLKFRQELPDATVYQSKKNKPDL